MFEGKTLFIATRHHKEQVLAPLLEKVLGVCCVTDPSLDTDALGTFSGEVPRKSDPLQTAREKCRMGMAKSGCDLILASEGSFGPHPHLYFVPGNEELLLLMDVKNELEISAHTLSADTNFSGQDVSLESELLAFAQRARFPSHGLILRKSQDETEGMVKGITGQDQLLHAFNALKAQYGSAYVETDMRALYNPTRMRVIGEAAQQLLARIASRCPRCQAPGFWVSEAIPGLPCGQCGRPTRSAYAHLYRCLKCPFQEKRVFPHQKTQEDPGYCDFCNP
jgi:hypothetical protein